MNYKNVRDKFVEISGRYDLIKSTGEDNGADFFLNVGQKFLDRAMESGKAVGRYVFLLEANQYIVKTTGLRAIKEVWMATNVAKRQLVKLSLADLKDSYAAEFSDQNSGSPAVYAPAFFRPFPDTLATVTSLNNVSDLLIYSATPPSQHFNYNGIVVMPPPNSACTIEILGLFYSPTLYANLVDDEWEQSESYWSEVHPELLITAAIYKLNAMYLNKGGAEDYKQLVAEDITGIDYDLVEEELIGELIMNG